MAVAHQMAPRPGRNIVHRNNATAPPRSCHRREVAGRQLSQLHLWQPRRWLPGVSTIAGHPTTTMAPTTRRLGRSLVLTRDGLACREAVFLTRGSPIHKFSTLFLAAILLLTRANWSPCVTQGARPTASRRWRCPGGYRCKTQPTARQRHASVDSLARHRPSRRSHARPKQLDRSHQGRIQITPALSGPGRVPTRPPSAEACLSFSLPRPPRTTPRFEFGNDCRLQPRELAIVSTCCLLFRASNRVQTIISLAMSRRVSLWTSKWPTLPREDTHM